MLLVSDDAIWPKVSASEVVRGRGIGGGIGGGIALAAPPIKGSTCCADEAASLRVRFMSPTLVKEALAPLALAICTIRSSQSDSSSPIPDRDSGGLPGRERPTAG